MKVVDCRICGDPNSVLRFAFIEFTDEGNVDGICVRLCGRVSLNTYFDAVMIYDCY